jgi:hypothetical protein
MSIFTPVGRRSRSRQRRDKFRYSLIFAVLGAIFVAKAILSISDSFKAADWEATRAEVTLSLKEVRDGASGASSKISFLFRYRCQVNGKSYESDRFSFKYLSGDQSSGVGKYKKGDIINIFYNPSAPTQAVVERGKASV